MSHQITKLITRISVLLPELRCLRLLCQQVLGNAQPEQSAPQLPTEVRTTHRPAQPPAARRDTHQASPTHTEQSLLPRAPGCALCGEKLVSVLSEETPGKGQPLKDTASCHFAASFKDTLVLRSTAAGISSALHWQGSPCSVDREKVPRRGPTSPWSPHVLLPKQQHFM